MSSAGSIDATFWRGRRVLLTGHTGFKGAWLALWLQTLAADVTGFSLDPPTEPSLHEVAGVAEGMRESIHGDVRDASALTRAFARSRPEVVIHMAAQPLVRRSYACPRETFETNVMGTVNVLEAARLYEDVRVIVNVTSDKCYANDESGRPFDEGDPVGGHDPYSASKGAAELVTAAYRSSFFTDPAGPRLASARAGNVIGGGDWGEDRLVADVMRAALAGETVRVRNPRAVRPWQHVLCPLGGYLLLAQRLWNSPELAGAWNFGPEVDDERPVGWIVQRIGELWPGGLAWTSDERPHPPEACSLRLDSSLARERLGWRATMGLREGLEATVAWWSAFRDGADMRAYTVAQVPT